MKLVPYSPHFGSVGDVSICTVAARSKGDDAPLSASEPQPLMVASSPAAGHTVEFCTRGSAIGCTVAVLTSGIESPMSARSLEYVAGFHSGLTITWLTCT